jgi:hypothetical protein
MAIILLFLAPMRRDDDNSNIAGANGATDRPNDQGPVSLVT